MTDFRWLTPDGSVQRTAFGDKTEILANFSPGDFRDGDTVLVRNSVLVKRPAFGKPRVYVAQ